MSTLLSWRRNNGGRRMFAMTGVLAGLLSSMPAWAGVININTPIGEVQVDVSSVAPTGDLIKPGDPQPTGFTPPTIFSAPLPSGSGARALGLAGAFTALADDATAASWNPAGLTQLERPEVSVVTRYTSERQEHTSDASDFDVGSDRFSSFNLNYLSLVWPMRLGQHNLCMSANYQEVYDFTQEFTADLSQYDTKNVGQSRRDTYHSTKTQPYRNDKGTMTLTTHLTTEATTSIDQLLSQDMVSDLSFEQQGNISALTPAMAVEVTPNFSLGGSFNYYRDDLAPNGKIRSKVKAHYQGTSGSQASILNSRVTTGTYDYTGVANIRTNIIVHVGDHDIVIPVDLKVPFAGTGPIEPQYENTPSYPNRNLLINGEYEEINDFSDLAGYNATLGALWTVSRFVSLGVTLDLPWTAEGTQTKTVRNTITTVDAANNQVVDVSTTETRTQKNMEFTFPLYYSVGSVFRWLNNFYSTLDVSQTRWSEFSFKAEGDPRINPLNGRPADESDIDDCWSVRGGSEYLLVYPKTEIPLRAGVAWEQRPAVGRPDQYWDFSLGSGFSVGKDPGKLIIDIAYIYTMGNDVLGTLVPDQEGLTTDIQKHQVYVSGIWHF